VRLSIFFGVNINMEIGVVANVCSFVVFLYFLVIFYKVIKTGSHESLAMKLGLVYMVVNVCIKCAVTVTGMYILNFFCILHHTSSSVYRNTTLATPTPKNQPAGRCGNINSVDKLLFIPQNKFY